MRIKLYSLFSLVFISLAFLNWDCKKAPAYGQHSYKTRNVIIVVVDGPRYTETWGLASRSLIPNRSALLGEGSLCNNFYNDGPTYTNAGHTAICTGYYQNINNGGNEYPLYPSLFQLWRKHSQRAADQAWVIASKDKLAILSDCKEDEWEGLFRPSIDCGVSGLGTGYRSDSITLSKAKNILTTKHPGLMLINFKEPDASAHAGDSSGYVQGIIDTDRYIKELWDLIQSDPYYSNLTTLIVTNDHGRHAAGHLDGYISHTDRCEGCKRIEFFGIGPDFKKNYVSEKHYDQIDITNTVAELLGFPMPYAKGEVIRDIIKL